MYLVARHSNCLLPCISFYLGSGWRRASMQAIYMPMSVDEFTSSFDILFFCEVLWTWNWHATAKYLQHFCFSIRFENRWISHMKNGIFFFINSSKGCAELAKICRLNFRCEVHPNSNPFRREIKHISAGNWKCAPTEERMWTDEKKKSNQNRHSLIDFNESCCMRGEWTDWLTTKSVWEKCQNQWLLVNSIWINW